MLATLLARRGALLNPRFRNPRHARACSLPCADAYTCLRPGIHVWLHFGTKDVDAGHGERRAASACPAMTKSSNTAYCLIPAALITSRLAAVSRATNSSICLGVIGMGFDAELLQALLHRRLGQHLDAGGMKLVDDVARRLCRHPHAEPDHAVGVFQAGLRRRRHVGQIGDAFGRRHQQRAHLAGAGSRAMRWRAGRNRNRSGRRECRRPPRRRRDRARGWSRCRRRGGISRR